MLALIVKELRYYANQRRYRRVQVVILSLIAFTLFAAAFELFESQTGAQTNVGAGLYGILVIVLFVALLCFVVPVQIIEALQIEKQGSNFDLLSMTPFNTWKLLAGQLIGAIIAALWPIWLASPLFWISIYTGGLRFMQLLACTLVGLTASLVFLMVGIGFSLFGSSRHATSRSYAVILPITFLPLILSHTFTLAPRGEELLRVLSPLCVLLAIVRSDTDFLYGVGPIWVWMICFYAVLLAIMFWSTGRGIANFGNVR